MVFIDALLVQQELRAMDNLLHQDFFRTRNAAPRKLQALTLALSHRMGEGKQNAKIRSETIGGLE